MSCHVALINWKQRLTAVHAIEVFSVMEKLEVVTEVATQVATLVTTSLAA